MFFTRFKRAHLYAGIAPAALMLATGATGQTTQPSATQASDPGTTAGQATPATPPNTGDSQSAADQSTAADAGAQDIVVTGTLFGQTTVTPSPVTTVTLDSLDRRGISTVQEGLQALASNNGPALTNSFTANGAFAAGASAVSLRGLSTNSTLVLFDGLRAAYYPLADDGSRNFVDLNTIPDDIVERVEVLRDGASSSYGADAIAGVVNIITKREVKGLSGRAEAGVSERGDASQYRLSLTGGVGDLASDGFNAYLSGFYYRSQELHNRDRPYPFNSADQRGICPPGTTAPNSACGPNNVFGGLNSAGQYDQGANFLGGNNPPQSTFIARAYDPTNTTAVGANYVNLDLQDCPGSVYTLTAADRANPINAVVPDRVCQVDNTNRYGVIAPQIERFGASGRLTAKLGASEGYLELNFLQSRVTYDGPPSAVLGTANTGIDYPRFSTVGASSSRALGSGPLALPVYICPRNGQSAVLANGVATLPGGCAATTPGAKLNPNNPFAAAGNVARIVGLNVPEQQFNETRSRTYRAALGIKGSITDGITYDVNATAMHVDLRQVTDGYIYIQHLLDVIADGSYNFLDPRSTSRSTLDYLTPVSRTDDSSDQYQIQAVIGAKLLDLPGGPLQLGIGGSLRYEAVDAPSANDDFNGPTQRFFVLNAFGTSGSRRIYSAFAELDAPILDQIDVNLAGRYDRYSSGQDAFSPKVGVKFTPIRQVVLRGTYSKGFRIPSFGEANALPTTGFVTNSASNFTDAYLAQYSTANATCSKATFSQCPSYIRTGIYGLTQLASPNLDPERSRSFTGGFVLKPTRRVSLSVDYYDIRKTGAITFPNSGPALLAYYSGAAIPSNFTVIADSPDPGFPNAKPRVGFVQGSLVNANTVQTNGIDFGINADVGLPGSLRLSSSLDASYIFKLYTRFADGTVERYDGTLGNFNLTAGSGTPKWHGTWVNTVESDTFSLSGTVNYFDGYDLSATDQGTGYKDGSLNPGYSPSGNRVSSYVTVDANAQLKLTDRFTFYVDVINIADRLPPIDVVTYGAARYNPVQGGTGILGRYFKAGVKVGF